MIDLFRGFLGALGVVLLMFAMFGMDIGVWPPVIIIVVAIAVMLSPDRR